MNPTPVWLVLVEVAFIGVIPGFVLGAAWMRRVLRREAERAEFFAKYARDSLSEIDRYEREATESRRKLVDVEGENRTLHVKLGRAFVALEASRDAKEQASNVQD